MNDFVAIRREFVDLMKTLSADAVRVFIVLVDRNEQQKNIRLGMSLTELARTADVGLAAAKRSVLVELIDRRCIDWNENGKRIIVSEALIGEKPTPIPFTFDDTDQTKIGRLEEELRRVANNNQSVESSGLADVLQAEEQELVREIERSRGYGLGVREAYLLAKGIARFGPERFKETWRQMQRQKDPIRAAYASLQKGIKGKGASVVESQPFQKVHYRDIE